VIQVVRADRPARDEPRGERAEGQVGVELDELEPLVIQLLFELVFDLLGLFAIGGSGRLRIADAISIEVAPPNVSTFQ